MTNVIQLPRKVTKQEPKQVRLGAYALSYGGFVAVVATNDNTLRLAA